MENVTDNFYPNAIQCLMSLYLEKIQNLDSGNHEDLDNVWDDITKDMKESFFEFTYDEIKIKFYNLWQQYMETASDIDTKKFEYFNQMREIHEVLRAKNFSTFLETKITQTNFTHQSQIIRKDAVKVIQIGRIANSEKKLSNIVPLPFEEINEVEANTFTETKIEVIDDAQEFQSNEHDDDSPTAKRQKIIKSEYETILTDGELLYHPSTENIPLPTESPLIKDMTLAEFNEQQERRHQENLNLARLHLKALEDIRNLQLEMLRKL